MIYAERTFYAVMKEMMPKTRIKRADIILTVIFLIIAVLFFASYNLFFHKAGTMVQVMADGRVIKTLPLNKDVTVTVNGYNNGTNILQIKDGYASVIGADCPDKLCQKQKKIRHNGETIVCLPHKIIISVISGEEPGIDGVAG